MDIDPRLRADASAGQYSPVHRTTTSSAPLPLAPSPAHIPIAPQYQSRNHGSPHSEPRMDSPNASGVERENSEQAGSPGEGENGEQKRPRACEACRGLKVKCHFETSDPNGMCARCAKANRPCIVTAPSRKRQKKTDSRVAELEKKIDALTASLQASKSPLAPVIRPGESIPEHYTPYTAPRPYEQAAPGGLPPYLEPSGRSGSWPPADTFRRQSESDTRPGLPSPLAAGQKRKHEESRDTSIMSMTHVATTHPSDSTARQRVGAPLIVSEPTFEGANREPSHYVDVIDRGIVGMEKATKMFDRFINKMMHHMPAVIFPPSTTAADVRKSKPTLFLAVLCAGAGTDNPEIQRVLTKELMAIFAEKVICHGEKTLELVQALLVSTIWYWPPEHFEELKFYQLIHLAAVMALDINMNKRSKIPKSRHVPAGPWRRTPFPDAESLEARRAWLGCYFMCAATAMGLRRPNLIRWTNYMAECVDVLETSPEAAPTDKILCQWVRVQHIAEDVSLQFQMDDPMATVNIADSKVQYALKGFERDLDHWSKQVPAELRTPTLSLTENVINLYMHEVAMHVDHNVEEFKPPFTEEGLRGSGVSRDDSTPLTAAHIDALSACLTSIDGAFEAFFALDIDTIRTLPILYFVRVAYTVVVLIKMYFAAAKPNSELGKVINKDHMKVESHLDNLLDKFRATAADDKSRPASKFLMVLVMLKTWFHRSKTSKRPSVSISGGQPFAPGDAETPAPTPGPAIGNPPPPTPRQQQAAVAQMHTPQTTDYSEANTPLQLLSEVATGPHGTPRAAPPATSTAEGTAMYPTSSNDWHPSQQPRSSAPPAQQQQLPPFSYTTDPSSGYPVLYPTARGPPPTTSSGTGGPSGPTGNIDPSLAQIPGMFGLDMAGDLTDFSGMGDGFEQAMGLTLGDAGDFGRYFQDDAFWGVMMDMGVSGGGGGGNVFQGQAGFS